MCIYERSLHNALI